ncbi:strawberry notch-like protein, partial [Trifolium medium]|nr:strawberry notch-like protein [Trifolium medium]
MSGGFPVLLFWSWMLEEIWMNLDLGNGTGTDVFNIIYCLLVHALNKLPYDSVGVREGVIFLTYSSLIASTKNGDSRMKQLVQWCGNGFDGLIIFDECHKAKNLNPEKGKPTKTAEAVRDIQ